MVEDIDWLNTVPENFVTSAEGDFEVKLKKKQLPEQLAMCILFRDWLIVSVHLDYSGSNWNTLCPNCGNYKKLACFSSHNSAAGSPGRSQNPDTVHLPITFVSNYTSLASLTEITHSPLTLWWQKVTVVCRPCLVTSLEERGEDNSHWASGILAMLLANLLWHLENLVLTK